MPEISESIRCFAEEPDRLVIEPLPPLRRIQREAFTLILSPMPTMSNVSSVRTTERELDAAIAEARRVVRGAGYTRTVWNVGPSSRPANLATLLVERGFVPATQPPFEPRMTAMALTRPPPAGPATVEARAVRTFEEYLEAWHIAIEAFNASAADAAGWLAAAPALWAQQDGVERLSYLAFLAGRPVGFAFALAGYADGLLLGGSGVRAGERGKGVYRALLAARWNDAVRLGKGALVIQAGAMSRPILERCGFETICHLTLWEDPDIAFSR